MKPSAEKHLINRINRLFDELVIAEKSRLATAANVARETRDKLGTQLREYQVYVQITGTGDPIFSFPVNMDGTCALSAKTTQKAVPFMKEYAKAQEVVKKLQVHRYERDRPEIVALCREQQAMLDSLILSEDAKPFLEKLSELEDRLAKLKQNQ